MNVAIFDVDGTITNHRHRLHLLPDHDAFYAEMVYDTLMPGVLRLYLAISQWYVIKLVTGRPEKYRSATMEWLLSRSFSCKYLWMRPDGDHSPAPVLKKRILLDLRKESDEPTLAIDDDPACVKMYAEEGLLALQPYGWMPTQ